MVVFAIWIEHALDASI
jgi:hypothetical protein